MSSATADWRRAGDGSSSRYIAPFLVFVGLLMVGPKLPISPTWQAAIWFVVVAAVCVLCWPKEVPVAFRAPAASIGVGLAVFVLWVLPDVLYPAYRSLPLFSNGIVGTVHSSIPSAALQSRALLAWRTARAALVVPIVEELFWRGWLMRWLISKHFNKVPLGTYAPAAFWLTAALFASEHGPYWDVGLVAGVIYNWWIIRTKSLADCMLAHGVTNLVLSLYVIYAGQWQYWQ